MNLDDLILMDEICTHYHVERRFVRALHDSDIIPIETVKQKEYIPTEKISEFEKMRRLHYEMNINLEGLEAIRDLLHKVEKLQQEKQHLKNRLRLYE